MLRAPASQRKSMARGFICPRPHSRFCTRVGAAARRDPCVANAISGAVTNSTIAIGAVDSGSIASGAVGTPEIASSAVTSAQIASGAVTGADID